jgi:hypothetical protein
MALRGESVLNTYANMLPGMAAEWALPAVLFFGLSFSGVLKGEKQIPCI